MEGLYIFPFFDWGGFYGLVSSTGEKTGTYYAYRLMLKGLNGGTQILEIDTSNGSKRVLVTRDADKLYVIAVEVGEAVNLDLSSLGIDSE